MTKLLLSMPDLHCASCEKLVKTSIGSRQGIQSISVSLENKEVEVLYVPNEISSSMIINFLREGTGYSVKEKTSENEIINNEIPVQEKQPQKESVQESKV